MHRRTGHMIRNKLDMSIQLKISCRFKIIKSLKYAQISFEMIMVMPHWGKPTPSKWDKDYASEFAANKIKIESMLINK